MGDTSMRAARVQLVLVSLAVVLSGCAHRAASTPATPGRLASHPFGPGGADADGLEDVEPARPPGRAPESTAGPVTTTNVRVTQFAGLPGEKETTIAVNPTNPLNLVAGAKCGPNDCFYSSSDGGQTWTQGVLSPVPPGIDGLTDPSVAFCPDGSAYYEALGIASGGGTTRSAVFVYRSTDGGLTWPTFSTVVDRVSDPSSITDKPWITCDTTNSAFSGRIYVEYTDPNLVPSGTCTASFCRAVKVRRSVDQGATWSSEVMVSANPQTPQNQGALAVGPSGELYVAWDWIPSGIGMDSIRVDKSTNGGVSFGTDIVASRFFNIPADGYFNRLTYPVIDVDRTTGPYGGYVYIAFADNRNGDPDILLIRSTNGGTTWSPPLRVNDDAPQNGADQWAQAMAVDPLGRIVVTFYDRRRYIGEERYEVWGAISRDGGQTFDTNFLIGDTPSDVGAQTFLGDYDSLAATSDRLYPLWADLRSSPLETPDPDIYTDPYSNTFRYDEVKGVLWSNATDMSFVPQDARFGADLDYDVLGGLLSALHADHGLTGAGCVAPLWPAPPFVDPNVPPDGDGYYFLVRVHGPNGVGTYGDATPPSRPNVRDPLDETVVACP